MNAFPLFSSEDRIGFPTFPLKRLSIARIVETVADFYGVPLIDLYSARRNLSSARPRHVAMFLAWELTTHSSVVIGRHIGGRDHTTVLNGISSVKRRIAAEPSADAAVAAIRLKLASV